MTLWLYSDIRSGHRTMTGFRFYPHSLAKTIRYPPCRGIFSTTANHPVVLLNNLLPTRSTFYESAEIFGQGSPSNTLTGEIFNVARLQCTLNPEHPPPPLSLHCWRLLPHSTTKCRPLTPCAAIGSPDGFKVDSKLCWKYRAPPLHLPSNTDCGWVADWRLMRANDGLHDRVRLHRKLLSLPRLSLLTRCPICLESADYFNVSFAVES